MALDTVADTAGLDVSGPSNQARNAHSTFPGAALFSAERRVASVGPEQEFVGVVGGVTSNRVVGDAEVIELLQDGADMLVVLNHAGAHHIFLSATFIHRHLHILWIWVRPNVNRRRIEPDEERFVAFAVLVHPRQR